MRIAALLTVLVAVLAAPWAARGQPAAPAVPGSPGSPGSTAEGGFEPAGFWEGYDARGRLWVIQNVRSDEGSGVTYDAQVWTYPPDGSADYQQMRFSVVPSGDHRDVFLLADGTTLDAVWYGPDAVLLRFPDEVQAVLARVVYQAPSSPARDLAVTAAPETELAPELQASLAALEGKWHATMFSPDGVTARDTATFEITVVHGPTGRIRMDLSDGERTETESARVTGGTPDRMLVRSPHDDTPVTFVITGDDTFEIIIPDEGLVRLVRDAAEPTPPGEPTAEDLACESDADCMVTCQFGVASCCPSYCAACTYVLNREAWARRQAECTAAAPDCPTVGACASEPSERSEAHCVEGACTVVLVPR